MFVGSGLARAEGVFRWDAFAAALAAALLINIAANFANDASDAHRGTDSADRIGPPRAVATGLLDARLVWVGTAIALTVAAGLGVYLAWISSWVIIVIGTTSILAMLGYTGGPWPYGYRGLGEVSAFVFFGLAAVVGSRYVHDATAPAEAWLLAVPVGLLVTAILIVNNVRDIDSDRVAGKRTLAVMMGRPATRSLFVAVVGSAFIAVAAFGALGWLPAGALLSLVAIPLAVGPARTVMHSIDGPSLVGALKATARLHLAFGLLLATGLQF